MSGGCWRRLVKNKGEEAAITRRIPMPMRDMTRITAPILITHPIILTITPIRITVLIITLTLIFIPILISVAASQSEDFEGAVLDSEDSEGAAGAEDIKDLDRVKDPRQEKVERFGRNRVSGDQKRSSTEENLFNGFWEARRVR